MPDTTEQMVPGDWQRLRKHLAARTVEPFKSVPFVFFAFLGPFAFGALGVWVEFVRMLLTEATPDYAALITAVSTYYPALGCSTALQLQLANTNKGDKVLVSFSQFMFSIFLFTAVIIQFFWQSHPVTVLMICAALSLSAIWLWWITNAEDPTYLTTPTDAATGGDVDRDLRGTLDGFQV